MVAYYSEPVVDFADRVRKGRKSKKGRPTKTKEIA
tara:strand:- start:248 stop:352 length:105 start_codon:yes stop_codon:yes gene_type:complete